MAYSYCRRCRRNRTHNPVRSPYLTASRRVKSQGEELSIDASNRPWQPIFELKQALWVNRLQRRLEKGRKKAKHD